MDAKQELRGWVEQKIEEGYQVLTGLQPSEAFEQFGFWLDPAETRTINGARHFRVIRPGCNGNQKEGWKAGYSEESVIVKDGIPITNSIEAQD